MEEIRIAGLMIGIELAVDASSIVAACMEQGLLINCTQGNVVRLLPAMTLSDEQLSEGCQILTDAILELDPASDA